VPAPLAACVGPYAPLAFLACGLAIGAVAICFAEGGSRVPTSGGIYGVIQTAFGPLAGYVSGTLLCVCCVLACGAVAAALGDVAATLFPRSIQAMVRGAVIVGVIGGVGLVDISGVSAGAKLVTASTMLKLLPLAIFVLAGATAMQSSNFVVTAEPDARGFGRAVFLAVFALVGMEAALSASGEVMQPNRTVPRALIIAIASTTILYVAIQVIAQGVLGPSLATSKAPLADAMARIHPAARAVMLAGTALSMLGWLSSDILGSPRQLFAFARDGLLPQALGRVHPHSHAPHIAILCYCTIAMILALTGSFAELVVLSTLATAALYIGGCAAAWMLARRGVALFGAPLNFRFLGGATVIGIGSMLILIGLGSRQEIIGLATLIGVSIVLYQVQRRIAPVRPS
jgi:APA family basic amino acid/polyamine antiporter